MIDLIPSALAQNFPEITPIDPARFTSVSSVLMLIVRGLLIIAGALAVIYIIFAGLTYITSAGDPERAQKAKNGILYAVIGIIVISLSFAIVSMVGNFVSTTPATAPTTGNPQSPTNPATPSGTGGAPASGTPQNRLPSLEGPGGQGGGPEGP